jgi:repressor of nif and glnA expression
MIAQDEEMMFTNARIESIMYQVTFNPKTREGDIVVNVSLVDKKNLDETLEIFRQVMYSGLPGSLTLVSFKLSAACGVFFVSIDQVVYVFDFFDNYHAIPPF